MKLNKKEQEKLELEKRIKNRKLLKLELEKTLIKTRHKLFLKLINFTAILSLFITIIILFFYNQNLSIDKKYFDKNIKNKMKIAIKNNGDLNVIKNIYSNRILKKPSIYDLFNKKSDFDKYISETPLSEVLSDLKTDYFTINKETDSSYLNKLNKTIDLHNLINPFDKLEQNQKNDFKNLRFKLGDNFSNVSSDVNRITDELYNKNQLVIKYLDKSNISFLISIIALVITIGLSLYQIYQNRKKRITLIIKEIMSNISNGNND